MNLLLLFFLCILAVESADPVYNICNDSTKIKNGSQVSRNIDKLLPVLASGATRNGFIATSAGGGKDRVYGLAQCRGDVSRNDCSLCIQDAAKHARSLCPDQADARVWYDYCFLRYDNEVFFNTVDTSGVYLYNVQNVTDARDFNNKLASLMDTIISEAVKPESKGLGTGKRDISTFIRLYALVQCTRDLSAVNCAQCLAIAVSNFPTFCNDKRGCRVLYSSCYVRYEVYPFFFPLEAQESLDHGSQRYNSVVIPKR